MVTYEGKQDLMEYLSYNLSLFSHKVQDIFFIRLFTQDQHSRLEPSLFRQFISSTVYTLIEDKKKGELKEEKNKLLKESQQLLTQLKACGEKLRIE